ncbi:deaminase [Paraburkholderia hospita]|uniref:deaminase n=1 Tax=Paraburkholderia hospita TaxID=169430 RepID=UPI00054D7E7A|nr:deaminase [Paraburkholderia hospita]
MTNTELMRLAVDQMLKCSRHPKVGAVISKNGDVLSTGFRGEETGKHAERVAIEKLDSNQLRGATVYTTLEPCAEVHINQKTMSCCELISKSGIETVCIGSLDPNGKIYAKGMDFLRDNGLSIELFEPTIRAKIESSTFSYDDFSKAVGGGKRRVRSVKNGKKFTVQFANDDDRKVEFRLYPLSMPLDRIDLVAGNDSVRLAPDASNFSEILDPMLYQDPSHYARLAVDEIAIVSDPGSTMILLVQVKDITPTDITISWEVRNKI